MLLLQYFLLFMCLYGFARDAHIIDILIINVYYSSRQDIFEDNKSKIRSRISKKDRQYNCQRQKGQYDKQRSTKHYTENKGSSNKRHT